MLKLKTMALIGASALAVSAASTMTAQAQPWFNHGPAYDSRLNTSYVDSLDRKITHAAQGGVISWDEARELRGELRSVQPLMWRVRAGQARDYEIQRVRSVVNRINAETGRYAWNERRYEQRNYDRDDSYRR
jgi:hypothetical protein